MKKLDRIVFLAAGFLNLLIPPLAQADVADIQCWGNNATEQLNVPLGLVPNRVGSDIVDIHFGRGYSCVLNSKAKVNCWGAHTVIADFLMTQQDVINFKIGVTEFDDQSFACANTLSGIHCTNVSDPSATFTKNAVIGVGVGFACALDAGAVSCWGNNSFSLPTYVNPKKMVVGSDDICVLDDDGVKCTGDGNSDLEIENVPTLDTPTDLFIAIGFACATVKDGIKCWGRPDNDGLPDKPTIPSLKADTQYALGEFHACGLSNGQVQCWGNNTYGQLLVPKLSNATKLFSDYSGSQICAVDDSGLSCWGANATGQAAMLPFDSISAGFGNTCISSGGHIKCWGSASQTVNSGPLTKRSTELSGIYQVGVGSNFACAFDAFDNSNHACWGDNAPIIKSSPSLPVTSTLQDAPILSVGFAHACSLSNSVFCFGANEYGQSTPPNNLQTGVRDGAISAGGHHTCAIDLVAGVKCWGQNKYGQTDVPKNIKNPRMVASGFGHSCVLDDDGVKCWGRDSEGQITVPTLKNPRMIQAGGYHTCAVDDSGVQCWGDNSFGQTQVPKSLGSKIALLTTGYLHSCAVIK